MKRSIKMLVCVSIIVFLFSSITIAQDFDFEGETVTIINKNGMSQWFTEGEALAHLKQVEEDFNVEIEFNDIPASQLVPILQQGVMGNKLQNAIITLPIQKIERYGLLAYLKPLNDVLDQEYWDNLHPYYQKIKEWSTYKGQYYGFDTVQDFTGGRGIIWNKDLFKREGLTSIYELMENDEWNYETFRDIALKVTRDTDGDGEMDHWGLAAKYRQQKVLTTQWAFTNGADIVREIDGELKFTFDQPEAIEAMNFYINLFNEDDVFGPLGDEGVQAFIEGRVAMLIHQNMFWLGDFTEMEDDYGVAFLPKGPQADDYISDIRRLLYSCLPVTVEQPRALIEVHNALLGHSSVYKDHDDHTEEVFEEISMQVRDRETLKILKEALTKIKPNSFMYFSDNIIGHKQSDIIDQEEKASVMMEKIEPEFQADLDDVFNK